MCLCGWGSAFHSFPQNIQATNNFGFVTKPFECNCISVFFCSTLFSVRFSFTILCHRSYSIGFILLYSFHSFSFQCISCVRCKNHNTIIVARCNGSGGAKVQPYIIFAPLRKQKPPSFHLFFLLRILSYIRLADYSIRKRNAVVYCLLLYCVGIESLIWAVKPSMESSLSPHEWTRCTQLQHFCRF